MAEADVEQNTSDLLPEPAPQQEQGQGPVPTPETHPDRFKYDESLLIKVKGRVKRPTKPDAEERDLQVAKLRAEMEKHGNRIKEIKEMMENRRSARSSSSSGNQEIIRRLQGLRNEFQSVLRQKQHIRDELQTLNKTRDELRNAQRALRDKLPRGMTPDALEAKIRELEYKQAHEPGTAAEEKALFKRLQDLNQMRPVVRELADIEARMKPNEDARAQIQARLAECDQVLQDIKTREEAERKVLDESKSKQAEQDLDIPALNVEKKECWDIIQALRAKVDEIRNDFNAKYQEYIKLDRNYNNYMRGVKHQEYLERQKAREERAAAAEDGTGAEAAPSADTPAVEAYAAEILSIDQLVTYLRKLLPTDDKVAASEAEKKEVEVPKGMKLMKKKDDDADFFKVTKKPAAGKKSSEQASSSKGSTPAEPAKKKLQHSLETLKTFMSFGVEVPQTTAELGATIEKLDAKKAHFLELRKNPPKAEKKAAAPAASSNGNHQTAAQSDVSNAAVSEVSASGQKDSSDSKAAEGSKPLSNGAHAAEPAGVAAEEKETKSVSKGAAAAADGVEASLTVDTLTQSVSLKLRVTEDA